MDPSLSFHKNPPLENEIWDLLSSADPDPVKVREYVERECLVVAKQGQEIFGLFVLEHSQKAQEAEILNISLKQSYQDQGYGKVLIHQARALAREMNKKYLWVGTGNSSIDQIAFYQKCGFDLREIWRNHFTRHYAEPIYENGIRCRHMLRFRLII